MFRLFIALVVVFTSACNCGDSSTTDSGADAGVRDGGGVTFDAGSSNDAGTLADAGSDAGVVTDAGNTVDAGGDSGVVTDAGADGGSIGCTTRFLGLGDLDGGSTSSIALALSRDGTTVVGQSVSANGPEAMRWRVETGMVGLGGLGGSSFGSLAYGVSADGAVVVGTSHSALVDCPGRFDEAFRWSTTGGVQALGDLSTGCFFSYAYGVSANGALVVGGATNALSNTAATWSSLTSSWQDLGFAMSVGNASSISAVTPDERTLVGTHRLDATASYQVFRWRRDAGQELLGDLDGGELYASALAVSDDGEVLVGFGTSSLGVEAFRWTMDGGFQGLGDFGGGAFESQAQAITPSGALIVGYGTADAGTQAAVWDAALNIALLRDVLQTHGVSIPSGWTLTGATGVAVNGRAVSFTGNGTNAAGAPEAWVATYCQP